MHKSAPAPALPAPRANRILAALPPDELRLLQPRLEALQLPFRFKLYDPGKPVDHVYFVTSGVASMVAEMADGMTVEIATVGPEGMVGMPVFLGAEQMASKAFMQVPGEGVRMAADSFREVIGRCPVLSRLLLRYTLALMTLLSQNAACNRAHAVEERCSRWLLMTQDRMHEPSFPLTQEFLAQMLGVRRPTVSIAAGILAKAGLITYVRGQITILDRLGLEAASCDCYRTIADEFELLLGDKG